MTALIHLMLCTLSVLFGGISALHKRAMCRRGGLRRVLLVARNQVAADYLLAVRELLSEDPALSFYVTVDRLPTREFSRMDAQRVLGVPGVTLLTALTQHWDLIVYTNHPYGAGLCFPASQKKLYVNHGLHTGKVNSEGGEDGVYGQGKIMRPCNRPFYDLMFAASDDEVAFAEACTPQLAGRVKAVGLLEADRFTAFARAHRSGLRRQFGFRSQDTVVHVISTWGRHSLYGLYGDRLYGQLEKLLRRYPVIFSLHPRFDYLDRPGVNTRAFILDKVEAMGANVNRGSDWQSSIAVADMAISDHSSLGLYHLLATHPVILAQVPTGQYVRGATFDLARDILPQLGDNKDWVDVVDAARGSAPTGEQSRLVRRMLSHPGGAREAYLEQFRNLC